MTSPSDGPASVTSKVKPSHSYRFMQGASHRGASTLVPEEPGLPQCAHGAVAVAVTAIVFLARSTIRRQWRGIAVITVLAGLAGAVVLGATAGARRTATSLDRFNRYSRSADVEVTVGDATRAQLRAFRRDPRVLA